MLPMKTHLGLVLMTAALGLALGCGSSGGGGATAPVRGSGAHGGGEADGHPHDDGSEGAADAHDHEHSGAGAYDEAVAARDACAEIAELCHEVDESNADAHECHVIGHSHGGGAGCDEHLEHCRTACTAAPSSGHADHAH